MLLVRSGQTIGKKAFGLRILASDGERPDPWRLVLLRSLVPLFFNVLSLMPLLIPLSLAFSLLDSLLIFGRERRCLHDYMAGTIVVEVREQRQEFLRMGSIRPEAT